MQKKREKFPFIILPKKKITTYSFSHITGHEVIHGRHNLRAQGKLMLNVEISRKFLDNIGLSTVEKIVAGEDLYTFELKNQSPDRYDICRVYYLPLVTSP